VAIAALVVSLSAVIVGIYEAALQRRHDRAEVWPHLEIATFTRPAGAVVYLDNSGVGPGIVEQFVVSVDGRTMHDWPEVLTTLSGRAVPSFGHTSVIDHAMGAGDRLAIADVPSAALPPNFWTAVKRVTMSLCYRSVFDERWTLTVPRLGERLSWQPVAKCPTQPRDVDF
jgi:hypothetical protein